MRLLTDECVTGAIVEGLLASGFDVVRAVDVCPSDDKEFVLSAAFADGRVLVTSDKDFGS